MSRIVAISQRVEISVPHGERRDALDQRWWDFLAVCGFVPLPIPNQPDAAQTLLQTVAPLGVILSGGNDLAAYGGDAPERDETEAGLLDWASRNERPVMAVCRGLQFLTHHHGAALSHDSKHAGPRHTVELETGQEISVNSYHNWTLKAAPVGFQVWARAADGTVEGIRSADGRIVGQMWHPEREAPFDTGDVARFQQVLRRGT